MDVGSLGLGGFSVAGSIGHRCCREHPRCRAALDAVVAQIETALHAIFTSLPVGRGRCAPGCWPSIGDCWARFSTAAALAGVAASTRRSGHARFVACRWASTNSYATRFVTSLVTAAATTPGCSTSTNKPAPAAKTIATPCGSWPVPGHDCWTTHSPCGTVPCKPDLRAPPATPLPPRADCATRRMTRRLPGQIVRSWQKMAAI